jgi:plasmid stabilization system protein ParE
MKPLIFHCEANVELTAAAKYYQCQRPELARDFLRSCRTAFEAVQRQPDRFSFLAAPVRRCRIAGFPYKLIYEEMPDCIHVLALAHDSRHPEYWRGRMV